VGESLTNGEVHLCSYIEWKQVHSMYSADLEMRGNSDLMLQYPGFVEMRKHEFGYVKRPHLKQVPVCSECSNYAVEKCD